MGNSLVVSAWHTVSLVLFTGSEATPLEKLGKKHPKQMSYSQTLTGWLVDRSSLQPTRTGGTGSHSLDAVTEVERGPK